MRFQLQPRGIRVRLSGLPRQVIDEQPLPAQRFVGAPRTVGARSEALVAIGERVHAGQPVLRDRALPAVLHVAPVDAMVVNVLRDARARPLAIELDTPTDAIGATRRLILPSRSPDARTLRSLLLEAGLWPAIRSRPFDRIANPDHRPAALLVTAIDTRPGAPDPRVVIGEDRDAFERAVAALSVLADASVFVCQDDRDALLTRPIARVELRRIAGPHPAGLASEHLQRLARSRYVGLRRRRCAPDIDTGLPGLDGPDIWHIGYQDVLSIGRLLHGGEPDETRVVALGGSGIRDPRLVRTVVGVPLETLLHDQCEPGDLQAPLVGDPFARNRHFWVGRHDLQVLVAREHDRHALPAPRAASETIDSRGIAAEPLFDRVDRLGLPVVPLLRALIAADHETAQACGALELMPEDLHVFSHVCPVGNDYGTALDRCHRVLADEYDA